MVSPGEPCMLRYGRSVQPDSRLPTGPAALRAAEARLETAAIAILAVKIRQAFSFTTRVSQSSTIIHYERS